MTYHTSSFVGGLAEGRKPDGGGIKSLSSFTAWSSSLASSPSAGGVSRSVISGVSVVLAAFRRPKASPATRRSPSPARKRPPMRFRLDRGPGGSGSSRRDTERESGPPGPLANREEATAEDLGAGLAGGDKEVGASGKEGNARCPTLRGKDE